MERHTEFVVLDLCSLPGITCESDAPAQGHSPGEQLRGEAGWALFTPNPSPPRRSAHQEWACVAGFVTLGFPFSLHTGDRWVGSKAGNSQRGNLWVRPPAALSLSNGTFDSRPEGRGI